jgi:hypothetical protein
VSERPSRVIEESDLFALTRRRGGGRRPGLPDDGSLRGVPFERRSRSVRSVCRVPPCGPTHRRQRMSEGFPRRGTTSALRSACVGTRREDSKRFSRGPGTRPSLGPSTRARQSSLNFHRRKLVGGEAGGPASRSGKPAQAGGTGTGVGSNGRCATRLVSTLVHNETAGHDEEAEGGCGLRPRETRELRFGSPHVVVRRCRNQQATPGLEYARQTRPKKDGRVE